MTDAERVAAIEAAFERHWRHFGGYPGASLHDEDGILWFESPIRHLPYDWVIRTRIAGDADPDPIIGSVAARFQARDVRGQAPHSGSGDRLVRRLRVVRVGLDAGGP